MSEVLAQLLSANFPADAAALRQACQQLDHALTLGHSRIALDELGDAAAILANHCLSNEAEQQVFHIADGSIGYARYASLEAALASALLQCLRQRLPAIAPSKLAANGQSDDALDPVQQHAVSLILSRKLTLLSGGPGTGKTYTLGRAFAAADPTAFGRVALAAPTGKAAQRLGAAVGAQLPNASSMTLHRLLGIGYRSGPRYHAANPLPFDTVVIDEASMIGTERLHQLLSALAPDARLVLAGDPDQLPPIDVGAPWRTLVSHSALQAIHCQLQTTHRFAGELAQAAAAVLGGQLPANVDQINANANADEVSSDATVPAGQASPQNPHHSAFIWQPNHALDLGALTARYRELHDLPEAVGLTLSRFRVLCAHRHGDGGSKAINQHLQQRLGNGRKHYAGLPIIITQNSQRSGLFNGDLAILKRQDGGLVAVVDGADGERVLPLNQLPQFEAAYALTVHKAQGSEFHEVWIQLDGAATALLDNAMLYTAITRARVRCRLFANGTSVTQAVANRQLRHSALADNLRLFPL